MKTLLESIFDNDLVKKDSDIQKIAKKLDNRALQSLDSPFEIEKVFDNIFEYGEICDFNQLSKKKVDLSNQIVMCRFPRGGVYSTPYSFIFIHDFPDLWTGKKEKSLLVGTVFTRGFLKKNMKYVKWQFNIWERSEDQDQLREAMFKVIKDLIDYRDRALEFSILPKLISQDIIKCILKP